MQTNSKGAHQLQNKLKLVNASHAEDDLQHVADLTKLGDSSESFDQTGAMVMNATFGV